MWDAATGALIGKRLQHDGAVNSAAFSPDGARVVTASIGQDRPGVGCGHRRADRPSLAA